MITNINSTELDLEKLNKQELISTFGGDGFAHDAGCAIRYAGHYLAGFFGSGGTLYPGIGHAVGSAYAEASSGAC